MMKFLIKIKMILYHLNKRMRVKFCNEIPWEPTSEIYNKIRWEPTDVIISSGPRQGTNWNLNIVHQLRMRGDDTFKDILTACLWIERLSYPEESMQELLNRAERLKERFPFRIFKTHEAPPVLPFHEKLKYIIPVRNGKDSLVSSYYFTQNLTEEFEKLWNKKWLNINSFSSFFERFVAKRKYWDFINNWWEYRHLENVMFIHFSDLKKEPEKNIRNIASFLDIHISENQWPDILERCSFSWMKANSEKFESPLFLKKVKMIKKNGMIRKGAIGEYKNLFSEYEEQVWEEVHRKYFPDDLQRKWTDQGGPLP